MVSRKCLVPYYGGKVFLVPYLLKLIPKHVTYCEVFGGAGNLLFAKMSSKVEILNDVDLLVVNLYRVLRDPEKFERLRRLLEFTPYSREEYYSCFKKLSEGIEDEVEKARCFYVCLAQTYSGMFGKGWCVGKVSNRAVYYFNHVDYLPYFHTRIRNVQIENLDFEKCIECYDSKDTFFYLDPPYLPETRRSNGDYRFEMGVDDHERLLDRVLKSKGKFLISGYDNKLYNERLKGWNKKQWQVACHLVKCKGDKRVETVWFNYDEPVFVRRFFEVKKGKGGV